MPNLVSAANLPSLDCERNFTLSTAIGADELEYFYHELAHEISTRSGCTLYLSDDVSTQDLI